MVLVLFVFIRFVPARTGGPMESGELARVRSSWLKMGNSKKTMMKLHPAYKISVPHIPLTAPNWLTLRLDHPTPPPPTKPHLTPPAIIQPLALGRPDTRDHPSYRTRDLVHSTIVQYSTVPTAAKYQIYSTLEYGVQPLHRISHLCSQHGHKIASPER